MSEKSVGQIRAEWQDIETKRPGGSLGEALAALTPQARAQATSREQHLLSVIDTLNTTVMGYHTEMGTLLSALPDEPHHTVEQENILPLQHVAPNSPEDFFEWSDGCYLICTLQAPSGRLVLAYDKQERKGIKIYPDACNGPDFEDWFRMDRLANTITDPAGKALAQALHQWSTNSDEAAWDLHKLGELSRLATDVACESIIQTAKSIVKKETQMNKKVSLDFMQNHTQGD